MRLYKWIKYPFFGRFMVPWRNPLTDDEKGDWERISVNSKSGVNLKGLFAHTSAKSAKATIVLGHPMGKEAKGYFIKRGYTKLLLAQGYNVLLFDINGFGESEIGSFSYFEDIVAISHEAKRLTPDLPIGYHGISLGGMWATIAFADESHTYDFAIVESSATTLDEFWVIFPWAYRTLKVLNLLMPKYLKIVRMIDRIREARGLNSLLLIYAEDDEWVPLGMGERFLLNSSVPTELWTVKSARHAEIARSDYKDDYFRKILNYFDDQVHKLGK